MKKLIISIIAIIILTGAMATTAHAAGNPQDQHIADSIRDNAELLESLNMTNPYAHRPDARAWGLWPTYNGSDFSEEAILARIDALQVVFPDRMLWGPNQSLSCANFTSMASNALFGPRAASFANQSPVATRTHTHADQLRVSDIIRIENSMGGGHTALVIDISDTGVITVAEGNLGGRVGWGRTFTMTNFARTRGHNSVITITSIFDANGDVMFRYDELGRRIIRDHCECCTPIVGAVTVRNRQPNAGRCGTPTGISEPQAQAPVVAPAATPAPTPAP
ncbi:MAG: hypothetical protein FWB91_13110, partial [Defluviitaleaceae bacterium]|nr:hypothetical protein [Defluviitaleaceae bacterium]